MKFAMFFIGEYTSMIAVSCLATILFFGGWLSPFPASWTFTQYLPSLLLIPFGLWVIYDGIRYENILGRIVLPGVGTVFMAIGVALVVFPQVNQLRPGSVLVRRQGVCLPVCVHLDARYVAALPL